MGAMKEPKSEHTTGDPLVDERLRELVSELQPGDAQLVFEMMTSALALGKDPISRLDRKIANSALQEMRRAFAVFAPYRDVRKATIFGSSRTAKGRPEYALARDFSRTIADRGWMIVTGAGPGILDVGHEGAGGSRSFGVNIILPFEATAIPFIAVDPTLINF